MCISKTSISAIFIIGLNLSFRSLMPLYRSLVRRSRRPSPPLGKWRSCPSPPLGRRRSRPGPLLGRRRRRRSSPSAPLGKRRRSRGSVYK